MYKQVTFEINLPKLKWTKLTTKYCWKWKLSPGQRSNDKAPTKTNIAYEVGSQDELSEGRLSSDDEDVIERFNAKIEKFEAEKDVAVLQDDQATKLPLGRYLHGCRPFLSDLSEVCCSWLGWEEPYTIIHSQSHSQADCRL